MYVVEKNYEMDEYKLSFTDKDKAIEYAIELTNMFPNDYVEVFVIDYQEETIRTVWTNKLDEEE